MKATEIADLILASKIQPEPPAVVSDDTVLSSMSFRPVVRSPDKTFVYARRYRGQWFRPEYDFKKIQIAQDVDSIVYQSVAKATDKFLVAGWDFVGQNTKTLHYIKQRWMELSVVMNKPMDILVVQTFADLRRYKNCMWLKVRNRRASTGGRRRIPGKGEPLDPVAGYIILPFESIELKPDENGHVIAIRQRLGYGLYGKEYPMTDVIHFNYHKKPGLAVGTPGLLPVLDDVELLRRIEENIEELIETNLFPVYHYKIGTDEMPEKWDPITNMKESDIVKRHVEYMPSSGMYISDHRHEIKVLGSESKALRIDSYISHFLKRVISGTEMTPIDLGMEGELNRSTANSLTKSASLSIEAIQQMMKIFIDFYVIGELLLEGGFDPYDPKNKVEIRFGVIDQEERRAFENQQIQLFTNKAITQTEFRNNLGFNPMTKKEQDDTYFKLYEEPLAMLKVMVPGAPASNALADAPTSNLTPEHVTKGIKQNLQMAKAEAKAKKPAGPKKSGSSKGQKKASKAKARPSNQHGTRSAQKTGDGYVMHVPDIGYDIELDFVPDDQLLMEWIDRVVARYRLLIDSGVSIDTVIENQLPYLMDEE